MGLSILVNDVQDTTEEPAEPVSGPRGAGPQDLPAHGNQAAAAAAAAAGPCSARGKARRRGSRNTFNVEIKPSI